MLGDSMGEYVVPSGLDAEMTLCEMINEPIVLGNVLKVFGFNENECPPKPVRKIYLFIYFYLKVLI